MVSGCVSGSYVSDSNLFYFGYFHIYVVLTLAIGLCRLQLCGNTHIKVVNGDRV